MTFTFKQELLIKLWLQIAEDVRGHPLATGLYGMMSSSVALEVETLLYRKTVASATRSELATLVADRLAIHTHDMHSTVNLC